MLPTMSILSAVISRVLSGLAATPMLIGPVGVGTPVAFSSSDNVTAQQWTLDGADVAGATTATFTQSFADSAKALRVRTTSNNGTALSLPMIPGVQNLKLSNTVNLRAMLAGASGLMIGCGDSLLAGMGAGGGTGNNIEANMRPNSGLAKMVAGLNAAGFPASKDASFGTGNFRNSTPALFCAMDPRWSFSGTTPSILTGFPTLGGAFLALDASNTVDSWTFTPGGTFDTVTMYNGRYTGASAISVFADASTTPVITVNTTGPNPGILRTVITVPAGTTSVTFKCGGPGGGTGNNKPNISGVETSTAGVNKIRIINGALSGTQVLQNAAAPSTTVTASAFVPRAVMASLAETTTKGILILNGWYNDKTAVNNTVAQVKASYDILCAEAVARGWDIWYIGYPVFDPATITQADYDAYEQVIMAYLRDTYNAVIFQGSKVFNDYATYNSQGFYADNLHLSGTGHQKEANSFTAMCKIAATAGALPA